MSRRSRLVHHWGDLFHALPDCVRAGEGQSGGAMGDCNCGEISASDKLAARHLVNLPDHHFMAQRFPWPYLGPTFPDASRAPQQNCTLLRREQLSRIGLLQCYLFSTVFSQLRCLRSYFPVAWIFHSWSALLPYQHLQYCGLWRRGKHHPS